jgi:hypothetical protein
MPGSPVALPEGINALRAYKSKNLLSEGFILQIYVSNSIKLNLVEPEKTLQAYENAIHGFMAFDGAAAYANESALSEYGKVQKQQSDEYGTLVLTYSELMAGTAVFLRYTKKVIPNHTLIEVVIPGPEDTAVYLFTGDKPVTKIQDLLKITGKLRQTDDLSSDGYLKIPLPQEIQDFYMENCGTVCP